MNLGVNNRPITLTVIVITLKSIYSIYWDECYNALEGRTLTSCCLCTAVEPEPVWSWTGTDPEEDPTRRRPRPQ